MQNDLLDVIRTRRSVRAYTAQPVEAELLEAVLEAGRAAPSGGNCQYCHFLVLQSPDVLARLQETVQQSFAAMTADENTYKSLRHSITQSKKGGYDFRFGAPVVIVVANRRGHGNAMADSAIATGNMLLAAHALGLGACYVNQLHWLDDDPAVRELLLSLGLEEEETVCCSLCLGHPRGPAGAPLPRRGNRVTYR